MAEQLHLRYNFLRGQVPWVAEADLLLSDLCTPAGYELYVMDAAVRACLLREMRQDPSMGSALMQEVARLLIHYIRHLSATNPFLSGKELQTQQWAAMVYLEEQRASAVREIAESLKNCVLPDAENIQGGRPLVDVAEMARLAELTRALAPDLEDYPELVEYAANLAQILSDTTGDEIERLRTAGRLGQGVQVLDVDLPTLDNLVQPKEPRLVEPTFSSEQLVGLGEALQRHSLVLFIGADLPEKLTGLPSKRDLAYELAQRYELSLKPPISFAAVSELAAAAAGLNAIIRFLQDRLALIGTPSGPFYGRLVEFLKKYGVKILVTTAYDGALRSALQDEGLSVSSITRSADLPFASLRRLILIQLYGDIDQPDTLVITSNQQDAVFERSAKQSLLHDIGRQLEGNAVLCIGHDLADPDFNKLFEHVLRGGSIRQVYAICDGLLAQTAQAWRKRGVSVINIAPLEALDIISKNLEPAPVSGTITWLHLSDLHFSADKLKKWDENIVLRALLEDVRQRVKEGLAPDLILVSGDIAFSGQPAEYRLAAAFFDELLAATHLSKEYLCLVPGNHDVDRSRIDVAAKLMLPNLTSRQAVNEALGDRIVRRAFLKRFRGYAGFVNAYLGHSHFDDEHYFHVRTLNLAGCRVSVLALNSAWLGQGGDEDRLKLALGERQVRTALDQARGADLRIGVMHHPFDWLHDFDRADAQALLCQQCDFVLHGHMHQVGLIQARTPDSNAFLIAAGACYETREYPNGYNYVQFDPATRQGSVYLRTYSDRRGGFWVKDTLNYRNVPDGVYPFSLADEATVFTPGPAPALADAAGVQASGGSAAAAGGGIAQTGSGNVAFTGSIQGGVTIVQGGGAVPPYSAAPAAAPIDTGGYNLQALHDLLLAAFSAPDLRRLFLYTSNSELRELTHMFGPSDGLATMVETVMQFCLQRRLFPALVEEVRRANPRQYERFAGRLHSEK